MLKLYVSLIAIINIVAMAFAVEASAVDKVDKKEDNALHSVAGMSTMLTISAQKFELIKAENMYFLFRSDEPLSAAIPHCSLVPPPTQGEKAMATQIQPARAIQVMRKDLLRWKDNCKKVKNWQDFDLSLGLSTGKKSSVEMKNKPGESTVQWQLRF